MPKLFLLFYFFLLGSALSADKPIEQPTVSEQREVFDSIERFVSRNAGNFEVVDHGYSSADQVYNFICRSTDKDKSEWAVYVPIALVDNEAAIKALFIQGALDYVTWYDREQKLVQRFHH
jgi:hypothetical protein